MLTWPHPHSDWAPILDRVEQVYIEIVKAVLAFETLLVVCFDEQHREHIREQLTQNRINPESLLLAIAPSNDSWSRDHGPITVIENGKPQGLDFQFNGWGGKYSALLDNAINQYLSQQGFFSNLTSQPLVLEGGAIESDGNGTLLTTSRCLLSPERNGTMSRSDYADIFRRHLGVERIHWLEHGALTGDDTDSHIDTLARFCDPETIAYCACEIPEDEHFAELNQMRKELEQLRTPVGEPYQLIPLPLPSPIYNDDGQRLPATYANFLIINGAVLVPVYEDPNDEIAVQRLRASFPGRTITPINALPLIQQYGSLHCITMQLPRGLLNQTGT